MLRLMTVAACLCAMVVQAQSADLTGEQIKDLLADATVEINTPIGTKLPVHCGRDGKLRGEAGDLAWYLGGATDRGRWWVAGDQVCFKWNRWFSSEPQCLRLRKEGRIVRWRKQDGSSGTASITVAASTKVADATPSKTPPAPAKAPAPVSAPTPPPGDMAGDAGPEPDLALKPAVKAAEKDPVLPRPVAPKQEEPPQGPAQAEAELKRPTVFLFKVANVRSDDVLNVRRGPSADFDIVGELPPGSRGIAITSACRAQWCPVKHLATSGWVNSAFLAPEAAPEKVASPDTAALRDSPEAPRSCLTAAARALLDRIEQQFGPVQVISTCRPGATIRGTWRRSRHASGNAVDFKAGSRKAAIVAWLIANHRRGGTMTYAGLDHIHVDIGPRFVSIAGGPRWASWRGGRPNLAGVR